MLHRPVIRWLLSLLCSIAIGFADYLIQTRLPPTGPRTAFDDHGLLYRLLNWTVPPEGQRGIGFVIDTAIAIIVATIIFYVILTRWERRMSAKRAV